VTVSIFGFAVHGRFRFLWLFKNKIPHAAGCQMQTKNNVHSNSITRPNNQTRYAYRWRN